MGKTALALNIAQHVALKNKQTVAIFSLEMSKESLLTRMLCSAARVDSQKFRAGYLNQEERRKLNHALQELVQAPLYIDDTPGAHLMDMHAKLRRLQSERHHLGLVIVDYLQLMTAGARFENRNQEVSALSRGMKMLAKELNAPVMVLSQLSRAVENRQGGDHRPQLSDLRESGSIEQDADVVAFVFREEIYKPKEDNLRGLAELIIGKQRNGPVGTVNLVFLHAQTKFENRAEDTGEVAEE
jgi:replicative DNA helicase